LSDEDRLALPEDERTSAESERLGLDEVVIVRDVVRLVEVVHLQDQEFFSTHSVLAGSMALRTYGSPRFTVFDADFSTSASASGDPRELLDKMRYRGHRLDITPQNLRWTPSWRP
jgi:hypothetical protein